MATMDVGPWGGTPETFNQQAEWDKSLRLRLNHLGGQQARDSKTSWAIESGRVYGLRQWKYNRQHHTKLVAKLKHLPTEHAW